MARHTVAVARSTDGDWVKVAVDGKLIVSGHSISPLDFCNVLRACGSTVTEEEVPVENIEEWWPNE